MYQSVSTSLGELVVHRFPRQRNRVPLRFRTVSPSIQHGKHNWFWSFCHSASEYMDLFDESLCFRHHIQRSVPWLMKEIHVLPLRKRLAASSSITAKFFARALPPKLSRKWRVSLASAKTNFSPSIVPRATPMIPAISLGMIIG